MDAGSLATIIVAAIALVSAYASQRAASKASTSNTQIETRVDMERDAYVRARRFDTETIQRLEKENGDLRKEVDDLETENSRLYKRLEGKI